MNEPKGRMFDELGKLMTDAAGAAAGVRREVETAVRSQAARVLNDLEVVRRDEFEAVKAIAVKALEQNEVLSARLAALEASARSHRDYAMGEPPPAPRSKADTVPDPGEGA